MCIITALPQWCPQAEAQKSNIPVLINTGAVHMNLAVKKNVWCKLQSINLTRLELLLEVINERINMTTHGDVRSAAFQRKI